MTLTKVDEVIDEYDGGESWLVMMLQDIQEEYNYLPGPVLERVAENLEIPLSRVYNVATFYSSFSLKKRGKHIIKVCDGTKGNVSVAWGRYGDKGKDTIGITSNGG